MAVSCGDISNGGPTTLPPGSSVGSLTYVTSTVTPATEAPGWTYYPLAAGDTLKGQVPITAALTVRVAVLARMGSAAGDAVSVSLYARVVSSGEALGGTASLLATLSVTPGNSTNTFVIVDPLWELAVAQWDNVFLELHRETDTHPGTLDVTEIALAVG